MQYRVGKINAQPAIILDSDKGRTLFAILRSLFWEQARHQLAELNASEDPQDAGRARSLAALLAQPLRVDFVVLMSLLPFERAPVFQKLLRQGPGVLPDFTDELQAVRSQFGYELSNA